MRIETLEEEVTQDLPEVEIMLLSEVDRIRFNQEESTEEDLLPQELLTLEVVVEEAVLNTSMTSGSTLDSTGSRKLTPTKRVSG